MSLRGEPRSLHIDHFSAQQLEQLADLYDQIRAKLDALRAVTTMRVPPASDKTERLYALRRLEERGKLTIRITASDNLSVRARLTRQIPGDDRYAVLIRQPAAKP